MKRRRIITLIITVAILMVFVYTSTFGWAIHSAITTALGLPLSAIPSDEPDFNTSIPQFYNGQHTDKYILAYAADYWAKAARSVPWYNFPLRHVYTGYALHFVQDAGSPYHAVGGGNGNGLIYESWVASNYGNPTFAFLSSVTAGGLIPVYVSETITNNFTDVYYKVLELIGQNDDYYVYVDTPEEWVIWFFATNACLYNVGRYSMGVRNYIWR